MFPVGLVYASFAEWFIHKNLMHRPIGRFKHFFVGHTLVHHGMYQADSSYIVGERSGKELTLAWWAMPFPILAQTPMLAAIAVWVSPPVAVGLLVAFTVYQTSYEYLHYCMHVPRNRWFESGRAFQWLNTHHYQHHRKHNTNLNIVIPIADYIFGTRVRLPQAALGNA
jgi:hypothetical protein